MAPSVRSYVNAAHEQNGSSLHADSRANGHYERSATRPLRDFKSPHIFSKLELAALSVDGFANLDRLTTLDAIVAIHDFRILRLNRNMLAHFQSIDSTNTESLLFSDFTPFMANYIHLYELIEHEFKKDLTTAGLLPGNEPLPENPPVPAPSQISPIKHLSTSQFAPQNGLSPVPEAAKSSDVSMGDASDNSSNNAMPSSNGLFTPSKPNGTASSMFAAPPTTARTSPPPAIDFSAAKTKRKALDEGGNPKAPVAKPTSDREFEQAVVASPSQMAGRRIATPKGRLNRAAQPLSSTSAQTLNRIIGEPTKPAETFVFGDSTQQSAKPPAFQFGATPAFGGISAGSAPAPVQQPASEKPVSNPFAGFGQKASEPAKPVEKPASNPFASLGQKPVDTIEKPASNPFASLGQKPVDTTDKPASNPFSGLIPKPAATTEKPAPTLFGGFGQKPVETIEKPAASLFTFGQKPAQPTEKSASSVFGGFGQKPAQQAAKSGGNMFASAFNASQAKPAEPPTITIASPSPIKPGAGFQPTGFKPTGFTPTPSPHGSGTNTPDFMAQFGQKAQKFVKDQKQKAKDEDFDSEEDDPEEWERNYKAKEAEKAEEFKKLQGTLALPPKFIGGGGSDLSRSVSPAGSVGSVLNGPMPKGPHIFSNVPSPAAQEDDDDDQGEEGDDDEEDEDEEDEDDDDDDDEDGESDEAPPRKSAGSLSAPGSLFNRITPRSPEKTTSLFGGNSTTPQDAAKKSFTFTPSVSTSKTDTNAQKSLFGGGTPGFSNPTPSLFGSKSTNGNVSAFGGSTTTLQTPAKSPFSFANASSTPKNAPNGKISLFGASTMTPSNPAPSLFSFSKTTPAAESSPAAPTPTPRATGFTFTPLAKTSTTPFKFPGSTTQLASDGNFPGSGMTTPSGLRTPTPVSNAVSSDDNEAEETPSQPQLDLLSFASYKAENEITFEIEKAKAFIHVVDPTKRIKKDVAWEVIGVGPIVVLKSKEDGRASIVMKAAPSGRVILNTYIRSGLKYEAAGAKRLRFPVVGENGKMESWLVQVGKESDTTEFLKVVQQYQDNL
jgi:hypothetical protein